MKRIPEERAIWHKINFNILFQLVILAGFMLVAILIMTLAPWPKFWSWVITSIIGVLVLLPIEMRLHERQEGFLGDISDIRNKQQRAELVGT